MKKTVVYISSCALHEGGRPDPFFLQELPWLRKHFDRVVMCSGSGVAEIAQDRPERITALRPALGALRACLRAPFCGLFWAELGHLHRDGNLNVQAALKLFIFTIRGLMLFHWIQAMLRPDEQTTLYAYWMSYDGFAAALGKRKEPGIRAIARAHAFDIDVQRNPLNPYLMKRFMAQMLDKIYPISRYALDQLRSYADIPPEKQAVVGVGSAGNNNNNNPEFSAPRFEDGVTRLVSCAAMIEVKQIPLLIDALSAWENGKLYWTHIGGGGDEEMIRAYAKKQLNQHNLVSYEFTGGLPPEQVRSLYETKSFDIFINTSKSEGIPVTVMEALHAGIPVVAPEIGGIPELVDGSVGCLYPKDGGADAVVDAILTITHQTPEEAKRMRAAARARWRDRCAIDHLLPQIFPDETEETTAP